MSDQSLLQFIAEMYDFSAEGAWVLSDGLWVKAFEIQEEQYEIWCSQEVIDDEEVLRVSFVWLNEAGKASQDLTNLSKGTVKVIATVVNSVSEQFRTADVYLFEAKDGDEKRILFYQKISRYLAEKLKLEYSSVTTKTGKVFCLKRADSTLTLTDFVR